MQVWDVAGVPAQATEENNDDAEEEEVTRPPSFCTQFTGSLLGPLSGNSGMHMAVVKFILEGHKSPVLSASFHPTAPLLISGDDQGCVKFWRLTETKAWEATSDSTTHPSCAAAGGAGGGVTSCMYHNALEWAVSMSQKGEIRLFFNGNDDAIYESNR